MPGFPPVGDEGAFEAWRADPRRWSGLVRALAQAENFPARNPAAFPGGTNLVVDLDGAAVLKLFPPVYRGQFLSERAALRQLAGRLSLPIPAILAEGGREGWSWLILTRLNGPTGAQVWPELCEAEKEFLLFDIGRAMAEVQAAPAGDLAGIGPAWRDFIARQAAGCVERHRRQGLPARFLGDLALLVAEAPRVIPPDAPGVILTGEWIPENFLMSRESGRWRLSALIDFGDMRTGWGEYDLLGPGAFLCEGRPGRVRSLLEGYGLQADASMRRRLLVLMVLHQESNLRNIALPGWQDRVASLFDLEDLLWPGGDAALTPP